MEPAAHAAARHAVCLAGCSEWAVPGPAQPPSRRPLPKTVQQQARPPACRWLMDCMGSYVACAQRLACLAPTDYLARGSLPGLYRPISTHAGVLCFLGIITCHVDRVRCSFASQTS